MTKTKARERAKAKALDKAKKKQAGKDNPPPAVRPGQFDPGSSSIKGPGMSANVRNFATARRGAARSK